MPECEHGWFGTVNDFIIHVNAVHAGIRPDTGKSEKTIEQFAAIMNYSNITKNCPFNDQVFTTETPQQIVLHLLTHYKMKL